MVRKRTEVSEVLVSEYEVKTVTRGIHYKFAILNSPKINTLGENCHQFLLAYQNLTKPIDLERGDPTLQYVAFSDLEGPKFYIYIRWRSDNKIVSKSRFSKVRFFLTLHIF